MAGNYDESFGDFTSASYPINALNPTPTTIAAGNNEEDDEWGEFLDYSRGSDPSNGPSQPIPLDPFGVFSNHGSQNPDQSTPSIEPATSQIESSKIVQWVKPRGALPLSLFGDAEDEEKPGKEEKFAHVEAQNAKEEAKKLSNGSNTDSSIISNVFFANFYNQNPQFQSGNPSSNAGESGNLSSNLDLKKDLATTQSFDWNVTKSESKSQAVESSSMGWSPDLNDLLSNQTGITSHKSVAITSLSDHIERIESVTALGSKTDGLSSDITASRPTFDWDFDFGGFGSASNTLNSSFSGLNSNSNALGVFEKSGSKKSDGECDDDDDDDGWEFKDACIEARDEGTNNKSGSTAQEIQETKAYMAGFGNGSDRPIDFFPMSNGSVETDSQAHYTGDMKVYSIGIHNGSNGSVQSELKGHGTSNILAYSYGLGNVSNHSIDLFSMSNGTDLEAHGGMNVFSSCSDGSAMSNASVKAETEAHDTGDLKANLSGYSESANGSIDLFTLSNGSIDLFATANGTSDITHENEVESNNNPSTCAQNGVETNEDNEDFGEFTAALSDSGSKQVGELKETDLFHELEAAKSGGKYQVNTSGPNCKGALPLSIFGDEELEPDDSVTIEDCFMHSPTSFPKSDKKTKPVVSINDVISSLYSQGEHTSSISSSQNPSDVVEPPDSDASSNLVKNEDAFGDKSWDYKSSITQRRADEETSVFGHGDPLPSCSSTRKLDNYVDFYSELKKELCLYSKYHFGDLKRDQSITTGEDAKGIARYEEIKGACKELDHGSSLCEGDDLEGRPSWKTCFHEFIEVLKEPKFQVLESEYNLSRRLSQMENDLNSAIELISHASIMLKLLTFASAEEQLIYVSIWYKIISVCNQELQHGTWLWKQILDKDAQSHVFSSSRGRKYILGLGEIYKVAVVLGASVKLYRPWSWLNHADFNGICSLLDECLALWSMSGLGQAISSISDMESTSTVGSCPDNIKSICDLDAFSLQNHISSQKEICRMSLLTSEVIHGLGMKLVFWNGEHYFLTLANLWANLVSHDPPELPHLSYGW